MVLLTVLNILVCAGTLVTVLAAKREIKGLGQEVSELYDVVEEAESAVYRAEDKIKALDKKFLELDNGINFIIDGNQEMFGIVEKIDKDQEENLDNLKEFIEKYGVLDPRTVKVSQELDIYIVQATKKKRGVNNGKI
ncbi:aspartyl-phosphate phosphatase Spo0E family protein [Clostridium perfringens]|uniref:aspartyl-phosphate phosphatase Spo0E family protein n=1 Tax=Clostridium perfringens TaxID=1502 RepID=UPI002B205E5E|nr:aspartyl-phosphate phosphatase Spo0E family protein [Clostridium perfringens]MEA5268695.1 aspartyl-phosphate phosphatase Spo0E family protein [Clostridium perfringens]MEA5380382.1 aspartyl-phosphate phosphatase Spo0E family protein [Clostridium perfringens]